MTLHNVVLKTYESFSYSRKGKTDDSRRAMKIMGIPKQKAKSNMTILLRCLRSSPTVLFPPTMARYLHIQSVHAGNAVEAPMISFAAAETNETQTSDASLLETNNSQISHHNGALSRTSLDQARLFTP